MLASDWPRPFYPHPRGPNTPRADCCAHASGQPKETSAPFNAEREDKEALGPYAAATNAPTLDFSHQTNPSSGEGRESSEQDSRSSTDALVRREATPRLDGRWLPRGSKESAQDPGPPPPRASRPAGASRRWGGPRLQSRPTPRHRQDPGPLLPQPPPKRGTPLCGQARGDELLGRQLGARRWRAATFGERHGGIVGVDGVEDALIADLRLGDEADLVAQIRGAGRAAPASGRGAQGAGDRGPAPALPAPPPRGGLAAHSTPRQSRGASCQA